MAAAWRAYAHGSEATHFGKFCETFLTQSVDRFDGKPLRLERFQREFLGEALAYDRGGWPVWRSVVWVLPRKNGKTTVLAAYALYRLLTSDGSPEILLAASSDKQAGRLFDAAATFVRRNDRLRGLVRVRDHAGELRREDGLGVIVRMSSDPRRLHGYGPSLVICDELAQWTTPTLERAFEALTSGGAHRRAPQSFTITTAGTAQERAGSLLGRMLDESVANGEKETRPGLVIARHKEAGMLVYNHEAPTTDRRNIDAVKAANPASWVTREYLARQAANPELTDAAFLQLHACVWAVSERTWLPPDAWQTRAEPRRLEPDEPVVLGFDGSYKRDATALVGCTLDGYVFVLNVWERPDGAPEEWKIPRHEVDAAVADAMDSLNVVELACDPPGWHAEIDQWVDTYGDDVVVEFPTNQRNRMSAACDRFRVGVLEGGLTHDGNPVLARHVGHCETKETPLGTVVTKTEPHKIDAAVAAVVAYDRASWHALNSEQAEPWFAVA